MVSIGTGYFLDKKENVQSMGLDGILNQIIASTTSTEDIHTLLNDFLPKEKYFRMNPVLRSNMAIDEKSQIALKGLKTFAKQAIEEYATGPNAQHFQNVMKILQSR